MDNNKVELREKPGMGFGLFAIDKIFKGETIGEFDGDIHTDIDVSNIIMKIEGAVYSGEWTEHLNDHCIQFEDGKWRYAKGNIKYSNHSCYPNCGVKELFKIVAMRDIMVGEELTWDYEMTEDNEFEDTTSFYYWSMDCQCGSKLCRGKIGSYRNMPKEIRNKYKGYISKWLIDKYGE